MIRFHFASSIRIQIPLLAAFTLLALSACGSPAQDDPALGSGNLRWSSFPVNIRADATLLDGGEAESDLHAAMSFWETRAGKTLFRLNGSWPAGQAPYSGNVMNPSALYDNVIFFQSPWPNQGDWGPQIAGRTMLTSTRGSINHAVVFINGSETSLCSDLCEDGIGGTSRRRLIAHELGHFLGFAHVQDISNIMYPSIQPGGDLDGENIDSDLLRRLTQ